VNGGLGEGLRTVVLASGSGTNLQAIIERTERGLLGIRLCGVISDRPDAVALARARRAGIPALTVDGAGAASREAFDASLRRVLDELQPGLVVLAGFMRILGTVLVNRYAGRMLNIHPSLLPLYPGLHTYRRVLESGDRQHGSTVHYVIPELDAGPGILQYRLDVRAGETEDELRSRVQAGEYLIYPRAIAWCAAGRCELRDGAAWLDGAPLAGPVIVEESSIAADAR
jgi:phosphoribosylglycinamide formyltransferase-1